MLNDISYYKTNNYNYNDNNNYYYFSRLISKDQLVNCRHHLLFLAGDPTSNLERFLPLCVILLDYRTPNLISG